MNRIVDVYWRDVDEEARDRYENDPDGLLATADDDMPGTEPPPAADGGVKPNLFLLSQVGGEVG